MTEAHIHGFANRLKRNIIVIDERSHQLSMNLKGSDSLHRASKRRR